MIIQKNAIAGTLESSDAQVTVAPAETLEIWVESSVMNQYGKQIKATVEATLARLGVERGQITVIDKGALDCTIKARVEAEVFRSADLSQKNIPWGGIIS